MRFTLFLGILFSTFVSYASADLRTLTDEQARIIEPLKLKDKRLSCTVVIRGLLSLADDVKLDENSPQFADPFINQLFIQKMFLNRLAIREVVDLNDKSCEITVRKYFYKLRSIQDFLYLKNNKTSQVKIKDFDFKTMAVPDIANRGVSLLNPEISDYQILPGDIMIAKGISFTSSTISQLPVYPSQFSHIALFVNHENKIKTMEAYIGKGVDTYDLDEALKNENVRIMVLRPKDPELAKLASQTMVSRYDQLRAKNEKIKYDYDLNLEDHTRLTCAEVALDAYETASNKKVILPEFRSEINMKNEDFIKKLGLKNGHLMFPADMELDTRFDVVLEWTNVHLIQDSVRKDEIMKKVIADLNEKKSAIQESWKAWALDYLWTTRNISWLWPLTSKILGLPIDFDADVPIETLKLSLNLEKTGHDQLK